MALVEAKGLAGGTVEIKDRRSGDRRKVAVADVVTAGPTEKRTIEVSGPVEMDLVDVAKAVAAQTGSPRWIFGVRFGGPAIRGGGLVPADPDVVTSTTLDGWLAGRENASAGERR